jgi:hypothetical protein
MWTSAQKIALEQQFAKNIRLDKVPGKLDCLNVQRKCSVLSALPWKKIKFAVSNQVEKKQNKQNASITIKNLLHTRCVQKFMDKVHHILITK